MLLNKAADKKGARSPPRARHPKLRCRAVEFFLPCILALQLALAKAVKLDNFWPCKQSSPRFGPLVVRLRWLF